MTDGALTLDADSNELLQDALGSFDWANPTAHTKQRWKKTATFQMEDFRGDIAQWGVLIPHGDVQAGCWYLHAYGVIPIVNGDLIRGNNFSPERVAAAVAAGLFPTPAAVIVAWMLIQNPDNPCLPLD